MTWRLDEPFSISPATATLEPGQGTVFTVSFMPLEACSYAGNACCLLDNGSSAECRVSGIGKFPYLSIEQTSLDFGEVLVGKTVERTLRSVGACCWRAPQPVCAPGYIAFNPSARHIPRAQGIPGICR